MRRDTLQEANGFLKRDRRHRNWKKIVSVLACIVVFCTTYALILPAVTLETRLVCGKEEHTHNEECYTQVTTEEREKLVCTAESLEVHQHTADCYDGDELVCGYADYMIHEHDSSCYDADGTLVCGLPEVKAHTHDETCYDANQELICDKQEVIFHEHVPECYDLDGNLICGKMQVLEHVHSEVCFQMVDEPVDTQTLTVLPQLSVFSIE